MAMVTTDFSGAAEAARELFRRALSDGRRHLMELESKEVLLRYGLPTVGTQLARSRDEALTLASEMGYPLVLKIASPDIVHKADAGGVVTNIRSAEDAAGAYDSIVKSAGRYDPKARIEGVVVQAMEERGLEVIVGGIRDQVFGPTVMVGLGGTWVEILKDVGFALAPTTVERAHELMDSINGAPILNGYRGGRPVDKEALAHMIVRIGQLMEDHPCIGEIDLNPVFARVDGVTVVDARIVLREGMTPEDVGPGRCRALPPASDAPPAAVPIPGGGPGSGAPLPRASPAPPVSEGRRNLSAVFDPEYAVVLGSSSMVEDTGMTSPEVFSAIADNIKDRFRGGSAAVDIDLLLTDESPGEAMMNALDPRVLTAVRDRRSCAVVVLPPEDSIAWARGLMELGIKGIIQITGGFTDAQRTEYFAAAKRHHTRVLGPNTIMGVINTETGFNTSFERDVHPPRGGISVISQSGGVGATLLDFACFFGIGIDQFVFIGDKMDVDDINVLRNLQARDQTRVVAIYMEGLKEGRGFVHAARELGETKPVVVLKGGRSGAAARRALSHTASIAGAEEVFDAACGEAGIIRADSIEGLFGLSLALSKQPPMRGGRVAVISNVGGPAILAADAIMDVGLEMAHLTEETVRDLAERYPKVETINPIDLIADARARRFSDVLDASLADPGVDGVMLISMLKSCLLEPEDAAAFPEVAARHDKPVVVVPGGGEDFQKVYAVLKDSALPCYNMVEKAAKALWALHRYGQRK